MPSPIPRLPRPAAAAAAALLAAGLLAAAPGPVAAQDGPPGLDEAVRAAMLDERGPAAREMFGTRSLKEPLVEPVEEAGGWAFGTATIPAPGGAHAAPETALFAARAGGDGWRVGLHGTDAFAGLVADAPEEVVGAEEKALLAQNHAAGKDASAAADTGLGLPWRQGVSWWMGGGPHGNSGSSTPYSSVDFNGGDGQVLAAGPGRVYKSCVRAGSALVTVVHPNGYSTSYYHMTDLTGLADGSEVRTGTYLGRIGNELPCGGSSSGAHVHLSLLRGGSHTGIDGMELGGWTFHAAARPYEGHATRNGQTVGRGGRLVNHGPSAPQGPTGVVDGGSNPRVNLRSGPGLDHEVVGTAENGTVLAIECTARGGTVEGNWGPTDLWNRVEGGEWISDGFLYTGSDDPIAPACG
ncbi:M23 family metallopeptidase [Nocardiopsis sp. CNT-189]|uniref:peptidoglycan DD-metalloendopeptidase family protein n=1 Tax=Nocardiopsis oceanisediminis TaxID=2816862 RepID=UPI003B33FEDF